jgi:hypothetical protein
MPDRPIKETLTELRDLPQSSVGAPCPLLYATEQDLFVTYFLENRDEQWDGTTIRIITPGSTDEPSIIVRFHGVFLHTFGSPGDEALHGHRLYTLGLQPYAYFEVLGSSWLDELERRNRVHSRHDKELYSSVRHFIFTFHDTTLEVLADSYISEITNLPLLENLQRILKIR